MVEVGTYRERWERLRTLYRAEWWVWLSVPGAGLVGFAVGHWLHTAIPFYVLCGAVALGFGVNAFRLWAFRCPRCGKQFFGGPAWNNPWAGRCMNCGLRKWETEPAAGQGD